MVDSSTHRVRPAGRPGAVGLAPRRHRRAAAPIRTIVLIATALAASLFFVVALLVADSQPIGPDSPYGALPATGSPAASPPSTQGAPAPGAGAETAPGAGPPATLAPAVSISRTWQPAAAQPPAPRPAASEPRRQAAALEPGSHAPAPQPSPAQPPPPAPERTPPATAPQPSPQPTTSAPPSRPAKPSHPAQQPSDDDGTHPGKGKHKGNPDPPRHGPKGHRATTDSRYATCEEVVAAGLGPYQAGRDNEYAWYPDPDGDGWACERSRWGLGRQ